MENLGKILKHIRVFNHLKQAEIANELDLTRSYISAIENNIKIPSMDTLKKYSDSFDIPLSAIMLFAENYSEKIEFSNGVEQLKDKLKKGTTDTAIKFLDWICK